MLACVTLTSACGGSSRSLSQLRSQATRVCATADRRLERIGRTAPASGGEPFLKRGTVVLHRELTQLRALRVPADGADAYHRALGALAAELTLLRQAVSALDRQGDPVIVFRRLARSLGPLESRANAAWQDLKVPACMSG